MQLYNTLTKQIESIKPLSGPTVTVYSCGPTVYDYPHIGNWYTFLRYDLLIRVLKEAGYQTKWVLNVTDVGHLVSDGDEGEDKLEKGARREGKTAWDIANYYTGYFVKGLERLNFLQPEFMPKATEHINQQIEFIKTLETKGYTYTIDDGIYFDTAKFPRYKDFANLDLDEQHEGVRVKLNPQKKNPSDFALWKFSPVDRKRDMEWDSPWGKGFPGWHIECSAMCLKYLGDTIDIHAGGIDHIPVHHTNEIAQSEAVTGKPLANVWMHNNHISVDGEKISKSLNNGILLEDIESKGYSLSDFRFMVLQSHYRRQSQFNWSILSDAQKALKNIQSDFSGIYNSSILSDKSAHGLEEFLAIYKTQILDVLKNDLNTPEALAFLHEVASKISKIDLSVADTTKVEGFANFIESVMGIKILKKILLSDQQKSLVLDREQARKEQNWEKSDSIRDLLANQKIGLRDSSRGTTWYLL